MEPIELIIGLSKSNNITDFINSYDINPFAYNKLKIFIKENNVDITHFNYKHNEEPIENFMIKNSDPKLNMDLLREYLLENNLIEYRCCLCSIDSNNGQSIYLHLIHKNNNSTDNQLNNLELICHNCKSMNKNKNRI